MLLAFGSGTILSDAAANPGKGEIADWNLEAFLSHHIWFLLIC